VLLRLVLFKLDLTLSQTDRSICLWHTGKKKPIFTAGLAHGVLETVSESEGSILHPRGIASLAALRGTDLFASGKFDSLHLREWNLSLTIYPFPVSAIRIFVRAD
jgi:ribosomal RNA-processing protein 9